MSDPVKIPAIESSSIVEAATQKQRAASDPLTSAWVGASAGSGKTKVLTDRILRLLLPRENGEAGTKPEKILAITFTKAGANEMAMRLSSRLSEWAVMDDKTLAADMQEKLLGRTPTDFEIKEARKLFARVVDTPGGLNIMTIHSFCQSVLGRFPIESGLPPHFRPLEEGQAKELLARAVKETLSAIQEDLASPLANAVMTISSTLGEDEFGDAIEKLVSERQRMNSLLKQNFGIDGLYTALCQHLGVQAGKSTADYFAEFATQGSEQDLRQACAALSMAKSETDRQKSLTIQAFWDADTNKKRKLYAGYKKAFLTKDGAVLKKLVSKDTQDKTLHLFDIMTREAERIIKYEDLCKSVQCAVLTRDIFIIGQAVLEKYESYKHSIGALDFDDLILKTLSLLKGESPKLSGTDATAWVMYKLDEGLDHILVDEAQDTNPEQWEIVRLLASEFFDGIGARETTRTLFVVGDEKQSIFSFQRAAPERFGMMRTLFDKKIRDAGLNFSSIDINTSFRSVQTVLDAVDRVYNPAPENLGITSPYLNHIAKRQGQAGLVEFWPMMRTTGTDDDDDNDKDDENQLSFEGWTMPDKIIETRSGSSQMAERIASTIKGWLKSGERLESYDRPIRAGDIMILVKSRGPIVAQMVRALKKEGVPVSGVDRMRLTEQIAVQDLCAAASFALMPDDDLSLATLLKSPFLDMSEESLFDLAYKREKTLWQAIFKTGDREKTDWLSNLIARASSDHPYEFFSRILQEPCPAGRSGGMKALRRRLGEDALDPIDEFLNSTLAYESMNIASLQGFLKWHTEQSGELKRELEEAGSAVRIMTVHGSKGLQAPIVFLPDTVHQAPKNDSMLWPDKGNNTVPYFIPKKEMTPEFVQIRQSAASQKSLEEYRRLLYVAMTRAEERLYVGGYIGKKQKAPIHWYNDIRDSFSGLDGVQAIPSGIVDEKGKDMPILRLYSPQTIAPDKAAPLKAETPQNLPVSKKSALPGWAASPAPKIPFPPKPLVPSRPSTEDPISSSPLLSGQDYRFIRGNLTHKLLQFLPDLPLGIWEKAAENYLAKQGASIPASVRESIVKEIMAILNDPAFGEIFGKGSLAEVPVTGFVNEQLVSGQIDRMLIKPEEILIIDYKTNRPPPTSPKDVPAAYRRQMRAYADIIRAIYPDRHIRCALLWTDGARLMEIDT